MKISLASDVHLEFGQLEIKNTENAKVLILSGDICVANDLNDRADVNILGESHKSNRYHTFFQKCSEEFEQVIYIAGNHEHYHGDFAKSIPRIREKLAYLPNIHFLDKQSIKFDDITFIGGTLWTDMNKEDPKTLYGIRGTMNDFVVISNSVNRVNYKDKDGNFHSRGSKFSPEDSVEDHKKMLEFIESIIKDKLDEKFVVVGHHAPCKLSTHPRYLSEVLINGAYSTDLSEFILDNPQIKLWTHGHTHHEFDYNIGSTRIVCNPRGYINYEENANNFKLAYYEL